MERIGRGAILRSTKPGRASKVQLMPAGSEAAVAEAEGAGPIGTSAFTNNCRNVVGPSLRARAVRKIAADCGAPGLTRPVWFPEAAAKHPAHERAPKRNINS